MNKNYNNKKLLQEPSEIVNSKSFIEKISPLVSFLKVSVKPVLALLVMLAVLKPVAFDSTPIVASRFKKETLSLVANVNIPEGNTYSIFLKPSIYESSLSFKNWMFENTSSTARVVLIPYDKSQKRIDVKHLNFNPYTSLGAVTGIQAVQGVEIPAGSYKVYLTTKTDIAPPAHTAVEMVIQPESGFFLRMQTILATVESILSVFISALLGSIVSARLRAFIGLD